jgi:rubredoxin
MTTRCLEWIRANCLRYTSEHIAEHIGCDPRTVRDIAYARIRELRTSHKPYLPVWLGIDETYFKGHIKTRCCVFVDLEHNRPVDLIESPEKDSDERESEQLGRWLRQFNDSSHLAGIAMDMTDNYRRVVKKVFPDLEIVADRYHIEKWANKAVDKVAHSTKRQLKKKLSVKWDNKAWKQKTRLLRRHRDQIRDENDLTKKDKSKDAKNKQIELNRKCEKDFLEWLDFHPEIKLAYDLKESFCDIYNKCKRRYKAKLAIERWEKSFPDCMRKPFEKLLNATRNWKTEFLAYFPTGKSNGYTEAFNSVLKRMDRSGNNYSFEMLWAKAILGRKPEMETVALRPPLDLESFHRDSQPLSENCIFCGLASDRTEPDFSDDPEVAEMWSFVNEDWRCPVCGKVMPVEIFESAVPAAEFSDDFYEDVEVSDFHSAIKYHGNFCGVCDKPFNADQLHDTGVAHGLEPSGIFVCTGCLEKSWLHGYVAFRRFATARDVKYRWQERTKKSSSMVGEQAEISVDPEEWSTSGPFAPGARLVAGVNSEALAAEFHTQSPPTSLSVAKYGCPNSNGSSTPTRGEECPNLDICKWRTKRPPLIRYLAHDLRPVPKSAQLSLEFSKQS